MNENNRGAHDSAGSSPELALLGPLANLEALEAVATPAGVAALELARRLRGSLDVLARTGMADRFLAHNLAVLVQRLLGLDPPAGALDSLLSAALPVLDAASEADPDDLALLVAISAICTRRPAGGVATRALERGKTACSRPHAGDGARRAHAQLVLHLAQSRDKATRAAAGRYIEDAIGELGAFLRKEPFQEPVARARVELLLLRVRRGDGAARDEAYRSVRTAIAEYEERFGRTAALDALELRAASERLAGDGQPPRAVADLARARLLELAPDPALPTDVMLEVYGALDRAGVLSEADHAALADAVQSRQGAAPDGEDAALRRARVAALEKAGDADALFAEALSDLQRNPKDRAAAGRIVGRLLDDLRKKAPIPDVPPELLRAAAHEAPRAMLSEWKAKDVALWLGHVQAALGAEVAAEHAHRDLLAVGPLRKQADVVAQTLALLRAAGRLDDAVATARRGWENDGHAEARLSYAELLLERGESLAEAEAALKPILQADGKVGTDARKLRDALAKHPEYEESKRAELRAFEDKVGIGTNKRHRLRVLFTGDGFALAELADHVAPAAYDNRHLRVMIRRADLPSMLDVSQLQKGQELFGPVRGEDDRKGKGVLRVYWIADGATADPGWSDEEKEKRARSLEERFRIGTGASLALEVTRLGMKTGAFWVTIDPPAPGEAPFPADIKVPASELPQGTALKSLAKGARIYAPVDAFDDTRRGPGERRYKVRGPVEVAQSAEDAP
jgi:hypothetical protein